MNFEQGLKMSGSLPSITKKEREELSSRKSITDQDTKSQSDCCEFDVVRTKGLSV